MTYVFGADRKCGRHDEDDCHEDGPDAGPGVDIGGEFPEVPGAGLEFVEDEFAEDGDACESCQRGGAKVGKGELLTVTPVQSDGGDVEDACDGCVGA